MSFQDRIKGALSSFVQASRPQLDYQAFYRARVVSQNADGTLELRPEDARLPDLSSTPIRHGLPGVTVKVAAGAIVLVTFENADPQRHVAALWEPGSLQELVVSASTKVTVGGPSVLLGDGSATQAAVQGDLFHAALGTFLTALTTYAGAIKAIADPSNLATPPLLLAITNLQAAAYLSTTVKVK